MEKLCERCKKEKAEIKVVIFVGGIKKEKMLCKNCSEIESMGISETPPPPPVPKKSVSLDRGEDILCSSCGFKFSEFLKITKFKCEYCYSSFEPHTSEILMKFHSSTQHKGKSYGYKKRENIEFKLKVLKRALEDAIQREEYERAAQIRDIINKMEEKRNDS
jgi:protein arginine kinase activator